MEQITRKQKKQPKGMSVKTPAIIGALTLGAGIFSAGAVNADLLLTDINQILIQDGNAGDSLDVDFDGVTGRDATFNTYSSGPHITLKSHNTNKNINVGFSVLKTNGFVTMLGPGDTVDASYFSGDDYETSSGAYLVDRENNGPWGEIGATGYVGFRFYERGEDSETNYGWIQVTRGSAIIGQAGFEQTAGVGAVIPTSNPVPEPGTLTLLATGALGLAALQRRRRGSDN